MNIPWCIYYESRHPKISKKDTKYFESLKNDGLSKNRIYVTITFLKEVSDLEFS